MPQITFRLLETDQTERVHAESGSSVLDVALASGIDVEHACDKACACTTCHVYVNAGLESLQAASEEEEDMLDKAWSLKQNSRLSCQLVVGDQDLEVEVPKYTINHASERH